MQINWYPGHMAKAKRLLQDQLSRVDAVIEICDARLPESSRNPVLNAMLRGKARVLMMNKADLANPAMTRKWQAYYQAHGVQCAAITAGRSAREVFKAIENLTRDKVARGEARGVRRTVRVMVVLDPPGLLWPKLDDPVAARRLAYISAIRDEVVDTFALSCALLEDMTALAPEALTARYKITDMSLRGQALLEAVCRGRGFLLRGGELDIERASAVVLDEFRDGKLGRLTLEAPPETAEKAPVKENNDDAQ